ncbi:MAG: phosphoribosylaminoimidazolesuccinocarboxamide synthase [Pseudonocardiales bacterium]|nr:phosphoribosylaminoimidazolesuccinocarboxamide synthase [Pseudonocardiales bacterium]
MELLRSGKVREVFTDGDDVIIVASDRVSVYDIVLPTPIPDKGKILSQLSLWWFDQLDDIVPNHVISGADVPSEYAGRALRCHRLDMLPVECIARGYLAGLGLQEYRELGSVSGVELPPGLVEGSRLPTPIFTPTTKAAVGHHDQPMTFAELERQVGAMTAARLRELTLQLYFHGAAQAAKAGIIISDTKFEFGTRRNGTLMLGDEVLTPDSSRFWPAEEWEPGGTQVAFDKQFVRDWATSTGWDKRPPGPELPEHVVEATRERYVEAYERLTGDTWL